MMRPNTRAIMYLLFTMHMCVIGALVLSVNRLHPPSPRGGNRSNAQQQQANTQQDQSRIGSNASPSVSSQVITPQVNPGDQTQDTFRKALSDWGTLISNVVIAVFTVVLACIARGQMRITDRQARIAAKQTVIASRQASISTHALKNAQNTDRAWLSLESLWIERGPKDDHRTIAVGLRNSGQTPARILRANITIRSYGPDDANGNMQVLNELPDEVVYDESDEFRPPMSIVSGELIRWRHNFSHTNNATYGLLTLKPGDEGVLWIYGYVRYVDVYDPRPHEYRWAREYDPTLSKRADPQPKFRFRFVGKKGYDQAE